MILVFVGHYAPKINKGSDSNNKFKHVNTLRFLRFSRVCEQKILSPRNHFKILRLKLNRIHFNSIFYKLDIFAHMLLDIISALIAILARIPLDNTFPTTIWIYPNHGAGFIFKML